MHAGAAAFATTAARATSVSPRVLSFEAPALP
jgi:hypothetical protein